jgi:hypothetical protein
MIYASVAPPSNRKTWKAYVAQQFRQETGKLGKYIYLGSSAKKKENLECIYTSIVPDVFLMRNFQLFQSSASLLFGKASTSRSPLR